MFSYQGSCRSLSSDSSNILSNLFRFVKNFFYFSFVFYCLSRVSLDIIPFVSTNVNHFLQVFSTFFLVFIQTLYLVFLHDIIHKFTLNIQKLLEIPVVFADNIERRKRDLNPRAGFPTYTLSRGASSAS